MEATLGGYGPVEKRYHMCRRRRWVRMRKVVKNVKLQAAEVCNLNLLSVAEKMRPWIQPTVQVPKNIVRRYIFAKFGV